jgi:hypothetical protein
VQLPVEYIAAWEAVYCSPRAAIDWLVIRRLYKLKLGLKVAEALRRYFVKDIIKLRLANVMQ